MNIRFQSHLLSKLPAVDLDGTVTFQQKGGLLIPSRPGVYLFHDIRGVLYVGRSLNLRRRFWQHFESEENPLLRLAFNRPFGSFDFSWSISPHPNQIELERTLIHNFRPICNRQQKH